MEELQQILYKYKLYFNNDAIRIVYDSYDYVEFTSYYYLKEHIGLCKFIHDNWEHLHNMIISNGYYYEGNYYSLDNDISFSIFHYGIYVYNEKGNQIDCINDINTIFNQLREYLDATPIYKPVIKNE